MHRLSGETVRLISSAQVITSVASVVKELVENSLDAHADSIEIKLDNFGIDKVEVRDNGDGIQASDTDFMGRRHYTSKLSNHDDLESLTTYGFRGEALGSLCAVSNVAIATKTKDEEVGRSYVLDHEGFASSPKPSQCCTGTTVTASRLFHNVPVRKQYYSNAKRRREELKVVEDLLLSFGIVCPRVRFSLSHNKTSIWQKNKLPNLKAALLNTLGNSLMGQLTKVERGDAETQVNIEGYLPKPGSDVQLTTRATDDRTWISVNGRPVTMKDISKVVKQYYSQAHPKAGNVRHVVMCLAVTMPTHLVDVNLEPNKTKVLLQNNDAVLCLVIQMLEELYNAPTLDPAVSEQSQIQAPPASQMQTHNHTTSPSTLQEPGKESSQSMVSSRIIGERTEFVDPSAVDDSEGISMICDILMNSPESMNDRPPQDVTESKTMGDPSIEPSLPNFSLVDEDGGSLFAVCPQSTQVLPSQTALEPASIAEKITSEPILDRSVTIVDSSRSKVSVADIPERSVMLTACGNGEENVARGRDPKDASSWKSLMNPSGLDSGDTMKGHDDALWSKGQGLTESSGKVVQPSVLFVPGRPESSTSRPATAFPSGLSVSQEPCQMSQLLDEPANCGNSSLRTNQAFESSCMTGQITDINSISSSIRVPQGSAELPSLPRSGYQDLPNSGASNRTNQFPESSCMTGQIPDVNNGISSRVPQASESSRLFSTTVTIAGNPGESTTSAQGPPATPATPEKKTGVVSSGEQLSSSSPARVKRLMEEGNSPGSQYDLVGKAPVKRPQDAFTFFIKEKKPEILRQHPSLDFMSVNKILKRQWDAMDEEERKKFGEMEQKDLQRYKDQVVCVKQSLTSTDPKTGLPANKKKKVEKLSNQSLIDEMLASQRERKHQEELAREEEKRLEIRIPFSVSQLQEGHQEIERPNNDKCRLVGGLGEHGVWTTVKGRQLSVFNQYRAQEVVLYHRLLATHKLPCKLLPVPIELTAGMFGEEKNWYTLLGMKSQVHPVDQSRLFIDERLVLNGFEIRQLIDPDTMDAKLEVVSMSKKIVPFYGIDDLIEIVETIATQRVQSVMECRPLKLANHLMGEAVRMARSLPSIMTAEEVGDIMDSVERLTVWKSKLCLHGKSFVKDIYTIPDVNPH